jgi:hypothetical protein
MMSWIDSRHRKISTGLHFQNDRHNTTKIQHCSISKVAFDLFTDILSAVGLQYTGNRKHIITTVFMNFYKFTSSRIKFVSCQESGNNWKSSELQNLCIYMNKIDDIFLIASYTGKHSSLYISLPYIFSCSEFVTMQSVHLNLLSVAGLGDVIIVRL